MRSSMVEMGVRARLRSEAKGSYRTLVAPPLAHAHPRRVLAAGTTGWRHRRMGGHVAIIRARGRHPAWRPIGTRQRDRHADRQSLPGGGQLRARAGGDRRVVDSAAAPPLVLGRARLGARAAALERSQGPHQLRRRGVAAAGGVHGQPPEPLRHRGAARDRPGAGAVSRQAQLVPATVLRLGPRRRRLRTDRSRRSQSRQGSVPPRARSARGRDGDRHLPRGDPLARRADPSLSPRRLPDGAQGQSADRSGRHPRHAAGAPQG